MKENTNSEMNTRKMQDRQNTDGNTGYESRIQQQQQKNY